MDKKANLRHCILIHHLPLAYLEDAVKSMSELTAVSEESFSLMKPDHWGGKFILDNEENFRRVLSLSVLNIHGKAYSLYSLVTDVIVHGKGAEVNAQKVECLLKRYSPVLTVYEMKHQEGTITYRAALNCPEIPEITRFWTELKISGYNDTEFIISPYCRFCRENGHFKSKCRRRKIPVSKDVTSDFPSLPNCKVIDKQKTAVSASNSTGLANFTKGSSDSNIGFGNFTEESSDSNIEFVKFVKGNSDSNFGFENFNKGSSDSGVVCSSDSDTNKKEAFQATSAKTLSPSENLKQLIPPSMQNDTEALKLFFSSCKNFKHPYKSALRYPLGIGRLLRQLRQIVKFNKNIKTKSEEEIKFIAWVCLLLSKLQYSHLKKNIQLEPFYMPPL